MSIDKLIQVFPSKRIKPVDGMAVTAAVWEEAHDYHRLRQRLHHRLNHGPGILAGLEVIASDPPDSSIYVLPGVAADPNGELIVLQEPLAYDLAAAQGFLYVLLTYGESVPHASQGTDGGSEVLRIHTEFGVETRESPRQGDGVELARVRRGGRQAPITDAADGERPALNEIDLRFRRSAGSGAGTVRMAVCYAGGPADGRHERGARALGRALRHASHTPLWSDDRVSLDGDLKHYDLVYLVASGAFQLSTDEMNAIYTYLQDGGTIFAESCRQGVEGEAPADGAFRDLWGSLGVQLEPVGLGHPLLSDPHLFAAPPPGSAANQPQILAGGGVVFGTADYGCLWQGERQGGTPAREELRAAHEWGQNLVTHAVKRWAARGLGD